MAVEISHELFLVNLKLQRIKSAFNTNFESSILVIIKHFIKILQNVILNNSSINANLQVSMSAPASFPIGPK